MKSLPVQLYFFLRHRPSRKSFLTLLRFLSLLALLVTFYSVIFHYIMEYEGKFHSWVTGFYWTLTVMSTLGFGDITFESDLGRAFSSVVLLSGILFLLILFPFTFIEFFYTPWMRLYNEKRAPTSLPKQVKGHVILTALDPVTNTLIRKLGEYHYDYVLVVNELTEALRLHDEGYHVVRGDVDRPETYQQIGADRALLIATTASDMLNTNIAYTVREVSETVPIVATADATASVDILTLAGASEVLQLSELLGRALARRVSGCDQPAHVIGRFDTLIFAEAPVAETDLVGKQVRETAMRQTVGVNILGVWERGTFMNASPDRVLTEKTVLVLAGSETDIERYNLRYRQPRRNNEPVVIIGGGRVGQATSAALKSRNIQHRIVERDKSQIKRGDRSLYVVGDAAELHVLQEAGIMRAETVVISTHDDDMNIYLAIYCRRLRPDIRIISRATLERNVATLHRAGADFVMSYASLGANAILTLLDRSDVLMVAEGLDIFRVPIPAVLAGRTLAQSDIRAKTACTVVAWQQGEEMTVSPDPHQPLPANGELVLIGTVSAEKKFLQLYGD
jgi:Trk K+ transport system NAD-binding subunit